MKSLSLGLSLCSKDRIRWRLMWEKRKEEISVSKWQNGSDEENSKGGELEDDSLKELSLSEWSRWEKGWFWSASIPTQYRKWMNVCAEVKHLFETLPRTCYISTCALSLCLSLLFPLSVSPSCNQTGASRCLFHPLTSSLPRLETQTCSYPSRSVVDQQ